MRAGEHSVQAHLIAVMILRCWNKLSSWIILRRKTGYGSLQNDCFLRVHPSHEIVGQLLLELRLLTPSLLTLILII